MEGYKRGRGSEVRAPPTPRSVVDLTLSESDEEVGLAAQNDSDPWMRHELAAFDDEEEDIRRATAMSLEQSHGPIERAHSVISIGDSSDNDSDNDDDSVDFLDDHSAQKAGGGSALHSVDLRGEEALGKRPLSQERSDAEERRLLMAMQRSEYGEALQKDQERERELRSAAAAAAEAEEAERRGELRRRRLAGKEIPAEAGENDAEAFCLSIRLPGKSKGQAERRFTGESTWGDVKAWAAKEVASDTSLPLELMWWPEEFELALSYPLTILSKDPRRCLSEDHATTGQRARLLLHRL